MGKIKKEVEEYKNKYLRALADYQNLEKRLFEEKDRVEEKAKADLILKFLSILDNVEKAEIFIKDEGLKLVKEQLAKLIADEGVEEIEILGKEYNPEFAEAIQAEQGDKDNIVTGVSKRGYKFKGRVLRPAEVKVSKK